MNNREQLVKKIIAQGNPNDINLPSPIVGIEDFFKGNNDLGSIGCNLSNHPGIDFFYTVLTEIKVDNRVQDILVEIHELPEDEQDWPFSERIYILANATIDTIQRWVSPLEPDEISLGWFYKPPKIAPQLKPGYKVFNIWWD